MIKSEELTNPNSCMSRAKDDEMTFVLLGRDKAAAVAIRAWACERIRTGKNNLEDAQIQEALLSATFIDGKDPAIEDMQPGNWGLLERIRELETQLNTPELNEFSKAIVLEAVHQRNRWGSEQDEGKTAEDWFWLVGFLAGKALRSAIVGDIEKLKHHVITTAAVLNNWHAQILGKCNVRPGVGAEKTAEVANLG